MVRARPVGARWLAVSLRQNAQQRLCGLEVWEQKEKLEWARHAHGAYLLRTNNPAAEPAELWQWNVQLTQAEAAFWVRKSALDLRPVFHQKTARVARAHFSAFARIGVMAVAGTMDGERGRRQVRGAVIE